MNNRSDLKSTLATAGIIFLLSFIIGGCVRAQYWAFKQKYPHAGVWAFVISGGK